MIHCTITYTRLADVKVAKKHFARLANAAFIRAIRWWHRKVLPKHFQAGAERRYRYQSRSSKYAVYKSEIARISSRQYDLPLVYTGELRRQVTSRIQLKAMKTKPKVRGRMSGPQYLRPAGRPARTTGRDGGRQPDMGAELTRTTNFEQANMIRMIKAHIIKGLKRLKNRRKKKVA